MTKLAHLLNQRADVNARIDGVAKDAMNNSRLPEGEDPTTDPNSAVDQLLKDLDSHLDLSLKISEVNRETTVEFEGRDTTLADLILIRQNYARRRNLLDKIASGAQPQRVRYLRNDGKEVNHLDVDRVREAKSEVTKKLRDIDNIVQETNWSRASE